MLKMVLFDLDGTLLPMDQDVFVKSYFSLLARKVTPLGYEPKKLMDTVWKGTAAMVQNDGEKTNEAVFWAVMERAYGPQAEKDKPVFEEFYRTDFQRVREVCGFTPQAAKLIDQIKTMGLSVALATNPLFPAVATYSRVRWAGLEPEQFKLITTYENSRYCKPNPAYYQKILEKFGLSGEECLMVGNDVSEDMVARELGMEVFLLTDCLINREDRDICQYPHGNFPELLKYIMRMLF